MVLLTSKIYLILLGSLIRFAGGENDPVARTLLLSIGIAEFAECLPFYPWL